MVQIKIATIHSYLGLSIVKWVSWYQISVHDAWKLEQWTYQGGGVMAEVKYLGWGQSSSVIICSAVPYENKIAFQLQGNEVGCKRCITWEGNTLCSNHLIEWYESDQNRRFEGPVEMVLFNRLLTNNRKMCGDSNFKIWGVGDVVHDVLETFKEIDQAIFMCRWLYEEETLTLSICDANVGVTV